MEKSRSSPGQKRTSPKAKPHQVRRNNHRVSLQNAQQLGARSTAAREQNPQQSRTNTATCQNELKQNRNGPVNKPQSSKGPEANQFKAKSAECKRQTVAAPKQSAAAGGLS